MLSVAVIAAVFFTMCIAAVAFFTFNTRMKIVSEIDQLNQAVKTEDDIVKAFAAFARSASVSPVKLSVENVNKDHGKSMDTIKNHITMLKNLIDWYSCILLGVIGLAVLAILACCFYMIRLTHRISGPIYVMTRIVQDMIDGREPQFRGLRDRDEFKELYAKLVELGEKMKKKR